MVPEVRGEHLTALVADLLDPAEVQVAVYFAIITNCLAVVATDPVVATAAYFTVARLARTAALDRQSRPYRTVVVADRVVAAAVEAAAAPRLAAAADFSTAV